MACRRRVSHLYFYFSQWPADSNQLSKLLLMSVMFATFVIPARAARAANSRAGLRSATIQTLSFQAFYGFALIYLWGRC